MAARSAAKNLLCYFKCMNRNGRAQRGENFCYVISNTRIKMAARSAAEIFLCYSKYKNKNELA